MKKLLIVMVLAALLITGNAFAREKKLGLGIIIGEPTGFSGKYWLSDTTAIDGAVAWSFDGEDKVQIHADYLWHKPDLIKVGNHQLPLYYGVGGRLKFADDTKAGLRIPVGLTYMIPDTQLDVFGEVAPIMDVAPDTDLHVNVAAGVRFYF
ncbi:MAG: hypothetical protein K9L30_03055 [Desulfobacterales bacterium]|nr:hypothetical protein [Desulfobacterales bacterium]